MSGSMSSMLLGKTVVWTASNRLISVAYLIYRTLIDHYEEMFTVQADLMDDVYTTMLDSFPQQLDFLLERPDMFSRYE